MYVYNVCDDVCISWMSTTKFQPTDARKAFPNFDEPQYKANFTVTQRHWRNFTALSNMPVDVSDVDDSANELDIINQIHLMKYPILI